MEINKLIDHTMLSQDGGEEDVRKLCEEAIEYEFKTVCIHPYWVELAQELLKDSEVGITTVIGFPLGANVSDTKAYETKKAIEDGADEIDMVLNVGAMKSGLYSEVLKDIKTVRGACQDKVLKVILETCLLSKDEIEKACQLSKEAGADYVKTSTGFSTDGAKIEDIKIMRRVVGPDMGVKASGGIRDFQTAKAMVDAGASRIGASKSIAILEGSKQ